MPSIGQSMLALALCALAAAQAELPRRILTFRHQQLPPPDVADKDVRDVTTGWYQQKVDHFDPQNNATFAQQYHNNLKYWLPGGPVFLFLGGEGRFSSYWALGGHTVDVAAAYNGAIFMLEHRYYGDSRPTSDTRSENLKYLSTDQALADIAAFIEYVKVQYHFLADSKWVVVGGSYAGNLAAWARLKFPHLVVGAVSSSAPLLAKLDFVEYYEVVREAMDYHSYGCVSNVQAATQEINSLLATPHGPGVIKEFFGTCTVPNPANWYDVAGLFATIGGVWAGQVQYNNPTGNNQVLAMCNVMNNPAYGRQLERLAALVKSPSYCIDLEFDSTIIYYSNTAWEHDANYGGTRPWLYQTCTEYGYYQTHNSPNQPFGNNVPLKYWTDWCVGMFGENFTENLAQQGVDRTNRFYGGIKPKMSNVISIHGSLDPWHSLGLESNLSPDSPTVLSYGGSHCQDLYSISATDSPSLVNAKQRVKEIVGVWLNS